MQTTFIGDMPADTQNSLGLATWSRERTGAELQNFITKRHEDIDVSDLLAELAIDS